MMVARQGPRAERRRRSQDETRSLLLAYGADCLSGDGLHAGTDQISLEDAVRATGVSRTSAYRLWSDDPERSPQQAYKRAVLIHVVHAPDEASFGQLAQQLITHLTTNDWSTPRGMLGDLPFDDIVLDFAAANRNRTLMRSLHSIVATQRPEDRDPDLVAVLDDGENQWRKLLRTDVLEPIVDHFGFVPRYGNDRDLTLDQAALAISGFVAGMVPHLVLPQAVALADKPLDDASSARLGNACIRALFLAFFDHPQGARTENQI